jgi:cysteine synthase A
MYNQGILSAIGKIAENTNIQLFAKLEFLNPGGSSKDRVAYQIIRKAIEEGMIRDDTVIIEASSGNMGIGLAQICLYYGLKFICVVDSNTTSQNLRILKLYGAEVDIVTKPEAEGGFLQSRINRVKRLCEGCPNSFWPSQYSNPNNPTVHCETTARELFESLNWNVDFLFCGVSTCGTIRGCSDFVRSQKLGTKIIAVDAAGSSIFSSQKPMRRIVPGLGAAIRPPLYMAGMADECVYVDDLECIVGCRLLLAKEGILAGGSSGGTIMGVKKYQHNLPKQAQCALILPDRGDRYLDTIYSDDWVAQHFGNVTHLWKGGT